ncbi:protein phosphatase 2C-like domain-containing protein 1 [Centroberyx affinis]|uniref:protein phosphatase 2C-like domain-containing protein 1 n=1 Tax=Centroberyx affinis TaxID=166261 RepID=UPI003A5BFDAC
MAEYNISTYKSRNTLIHALAICELKNSKWKKDMEDVTVFIDGYGGKEGASFFGVFDGFHGRSSALIASRELPVLVLEQLSKQDPSFSLEKTQGDLLTRFEGLFHRESMDANTNTSELQQDDSAQVGQAFSAAFHRMDRILALGRNETSRVRWSGCTALLCLIDDGEDQGVASPSGVIESASRLTKDHSTSNFKERKRIIQNGGSISLNRRRGLVEGITEATRGLGHFGDHKLKQSVIPAPYTLSLPYDPSFQLLVLASSGVWEVLDEREVKEIANTAIDRTKRSFMLGDLRLGQTCAQASPEFRGDSSNVDSQDVSVKDQGGKQLSVETLGEEEECGNIRGTREQELTTALKQESGVNVEENLAPTQGNPPLDYEHLAAEICREIVDAAVASESKENISVLVILLKGLEDISDDAVQKPQQITCNINM